VILLLRTKVDEGDAMGNDDRRFMLWAGAALVLVASALLLLLRVLGLLGGSDGKTIAAALTFLGVVITASVSFLGLVVKRQSERRLDQAEDRMKREQSDNDARLRLDAAMRAGALFNDEGRAAAPAAAASGLLALTELGRADLAVALLVELWDDGRERVDASAGASDDLEARSGGVVDAEQVGSVYDTEAPRARVLTADKGTTDSLRVIDQRVSNEVAVLVIDAALQSGRPNAELVAAELLCRNARRLDIRQSLHWPSAVDGRWNPSFGNKTKLLVVDALVRMALTSKADEPALQSLAVRLLGISDGDSDQHVKGCLGVLLKAILPQLEQAGTLMQGPREVTPADLERAANLAQPNPNRHMARVVAERAKALETWAAACHVVNYRPGALAATAGL
jgi:hypothetical protein